MIKKPLLNTLPWEILEIIVQYVDDRDIFCVLLSCQELKRVTVMTRRTIDLNPVYKYRSFLPFNDKNQLKFKGMIP